MLTRRKKQNILYLCIGIVIGVVLAASVAYFGVIANYTKEGIVKIQNVFPIMADSTETFDIVKSDLEKEQTKEQRQSPHADTIKGNAIPDTILPIRIERDTVLPIEPAITIKTDVKVASAIIPIKYPAEDTSNIRNITLRKGEIIVELWENPTNFAGYRKYQNKLIVYGIDIDNIDFHMVSDSLFLIYNNKKLHLKDSDNFKHYPTGFMK